MCGGGDEQPEVRGMVPMPAGQTSLQARTGQAAASRAAGVERPLKSSLAWQPHGEQRLFGANQGSTGGYSAHQLPTL